MVQGLRKQGSFLGKDKVGDFDVVPPTDASENPQLISDNAEENGSGVDPKRIKLSVFNQEEVGGSLVDISQEASPLGLILPKTQSFINLLETSLSQGWKTTSPTETTGTRKLKSRTTDSVAQSMEEKMKASSFYASYLKIGTWERVSKYEGDLTVKCYFAKRKLVWEVLEDSLKSKIEIQWSDICGIKAMFPENQNGILELELRHAPSFYRELCPQPRKHTVWHPTSDFTDGQAIRYRRHHLQFAEGTFEKHYAKLLHYDNRLFMLSRRPFPTLNPPHFNFKTHGYQDSSIQFKEPQQEVNPRTQYPPSLSLQRPLAPSHQVQAFEQTNRPPINPTNSNSLKSVMESPPIEGNGGNRGIDNHGNRHTTQGSQFQELPTFASANRVMRNDVNMHTTQGGQFQEQPAFASANRVMRNDVNMHTTQGGQFQEQPPFASANRVMRNDVNMHTTQGGQFQEQPAFASANRVMRNDVNMHTTQGGQFQEQPAFASANPVKRNDVNMHTTQGGQFQPTFASANPVMRNEVNMHTTQGGQFQEQPTFASANPVMRNDVNMHTTQGGQFQELPTFASANSVMRNDVNIHTTQGGQFQEQPAFASANLVMRNDVNIRTTQGSQFQEQSAFASANRVMRNDVNIHTTQGGQFQEQPTFASANPVMRNDVNMHTTQGGQFQPTFASANPVMRNEVNMHTTQGGQFQEQPTFASANSVMRNDVNMHTTQGGQFQELPTFASANSVMRNDVNMHITQGDHQFQELPSFASANRVGGPFLPQRGSCDLLLPSRGEQGGVESMNWKLSEIADHLLNDSNPSVYESEQRLLARVKSMHSLLERSNEGTLTDNTQYCHNFNTISSMESRSTNPLNGNGELLCQQPVQMESRSTNPSNSNGELSFQPPVNWLPPSGSNEDFSMNPPKFFFDPNLNGFGGLMG